MELPEDSSQEIKPWWHSTYRDNNGLPNGYINRRDEYLYQIFCPMPNENRIKISEMLKNNLPGNWPSDCVAIAIDVLFELIRQE